MFSGFANPSSFTSCKDQGPKISQKKQSPGRAKKNLIPSVSCKTRMYTDVYIAMFNIATYIIHNLVDDLISLLQYRVARAVGHLQFLRRDALVM